MSVEGAGQERGQTRIQQLMEMFPELLRQQVVLADYRTEGIRHTAVLDQIGRWAMPDAHDHYEYDYDEHGEGDLINGVTRTPKHMYFGPGRGQQIMFDSRSPYEVRYEGAGYYWLYRDGEPVDEVRFAPCPQWFWKTTSSGKPMNLVVNSAEERGFGFYVTDYCEYFKDGNQCRFCNLNTTGDHFEKLGRVRAPVKREQDVYETYLEIAQEMGIERVNLLGGGFYNRSKEADLHIRFLKVVKRAMADSGVRCDRISVVSQAMEEADYLRYKEAGATSVNHPMEVWSPHLFPVICPGKAKTIGREHFIECLLKAVEIFGWGKVVTSFVVGVEMAPPSGFKTEEEAFQSTLEGCQFWTSHGVVLVNTNFRTNPGSVLAQAPRPSTEYILRLERERDKLHVEYNLASPVLRR